MDSSDRLRQLRAQHRLVADHLAWLEAEIGREEAMTEPIPDRPPVVSPVPAKDEVPAPESYNFHASSSAARDIRRARIGCIALAVLVSAIVVFLVFGLPFLGG